MSQLYTNQLLVYRVLLEAVQPDWLTVGVFDQLECWKCTLQNQICQKLSLKKICTKTISQIQSHKHCHLRYWI